MAVISDVEKLLIEIVRQVRGVAVALSFHFEWRLLFGI